MLRSYQDTIREVRRKEKRDRRILTLRGRGWTMTRIGKAVGLTRARVSQILGNMLR